MLFAIRLTSLSAKKQTRLQLEAFLSIRLTHLRYRSWFRDDVRDQREISCARPANHEMEKHDMSMIDITDSTDHLIFSS